MQTPLLPPLPCSYIAPRQSTCNLHRLALDFEFRGHQIVLGPCSLFSPVLPSDDVVQLDRVGQPFAASGGKNHIESFSASTGMPYIFKVYHDRGEWCTCPTTADPGFAAPAP